MAKKKEEIKEEIDVVKLKKELTNYVDNQVKKSINDEIERANKRVIREKNKKILFRNITIIILLWVIVFLLYLLNSVDYFDKFFINSGSTTTNINIIPKEEEKKEEPVKEKTFAELKEEYGYLIDTVFVNEKSEYIKDYYEGNLTSELKKYIVLNTIDFEELTVDDYSVIDEDVLKSAYNKIFNDEYVNESFMYNNTKVSYIDKLKSYITNKVLVKEKTNIEREIISIEESDEKIVITTVEGLIKDDKLYNVVTNEEVKKYNKDSLSNYKKNLNVISYTFSNEKLIEIK